MDSQENRTPEGVLKSLFYHVALPAKLPQKSDTNIIATERAIVDRLILASDRMGRYQDGAYQLVWAAIKKSLLHCKALNIGGKLERGQLTSHLKNLHNSDIIILHVAAQNAGIIIHKPASGEFSGNVLFEAFEASPKREAVLASQTLSWTFPGTAVLVPSTVFYNTTFLENLSAFLEQASVESTQRFAEYIRKAGREVAEERETSDPSLITSFLTAILEANGKRISPLLLRKRVRDDVCWFDSIAPWRRLPYWLILRVGIARYLALMLGGSHGRIQYKLFMCIIHDMTLNDTQVVMDLESQAFLKAKLCRRLYKLDRDLLEQTQAIKDSYASLYRILIAGFNRSIQATNTRIQDAWTMEKEKTTKPIPLLPRRAKFEEQRLTLSLSRQYLEYARQRFRNATPHRPVRTTTNYNQLNLHIQSFGNKLLELFDKEMQIQLSVSTLPLSSRSKTILEYIDQVDTCYDDNAEQKSIMLLTLMETWMSLDEAACAKFPLLYEFSPGFLPHLMEALQLSLPSDIYRARKVESYIRNRIVRSGETRATLFDDPYKGCFAERYFDESPGHTALASMLSDIQSIAAQDRKTKEEEWKKLSAEYERLTKEYDSATCIYIQSADSLHPTHNPHLCSKCQLDKQRSRMTIRAFESPLPESLVMAKAVVFELRCPAALSVYRDVTWAILYRVAKEKQELGVEPKVCLQEYSGLQDYAKVPGSISLASMTKSFLMTHYRERKKFPVDLDQVCLPNGLKYAYFDTATRSWPGRNQIRPTFDHHCKLVLPKGSPFSPLLESRSFGAYGSGPSSYEIAASYSSCPNSLNTHEYMAFQYLLSGKRRRWISILTELGSSNLNMSTETTVLLFDYLAHQIGPSEEGQNLGIVQCVFRDASFCEALLRQLKVKLEAIASNWRETHLMEIVITLALRLVAFTISFPDTLSLANMAQNLLSEARQITLKWVRMLRKETRCASDLNNTQNWQPYLLWAALLCKRTYASYQMQAHQDLDRDELSIFIECSATVYDNIPDKNNSLGRVLRSSFIRDLRMMHSLKAQIRQSIERHGEYAILVALQSSWPAARSKSILTIVFETDDWLHIELNDLDAGVEVASYNYVFGTLLINGEPLTRLPTDPKSTVILEELFGSQTSLMKFPSGSPGMTHVLAFEIQGYQIHIGYDGNTTIVRAIKGKQVLELIPREFFHTESSFDLPAPLIDNCIHWLDLKSGILEIRLKSKNIWAPHPHNWKLNLATSRCSRSTFRKTEESLVDPYCPLSIRVSKIFSFFEPPRHLMVYQPSGRNPLTIDMPRMQLRWVVNTNQMLKSSHLQAEIDPSQCIDTWYGFDSKLVCRSLKDPSDRFVLVPLGDLKARKRHNHVQVLVQLHNERTAIYIRFMVNKTLGRIDCAAEPVLVYKKAEIHALTSFVLPDPLTGLTGVESSLAVLSSGISQPWSPLTDAQLGVLRCISKLSPRREYYPEDRKLMKKECWDNQIPTMIQREEFRILVDQIILQSTSLASFYHLEAEKLELQPSGDAHLSLRALHRRRLHERRGHYGLQVDTVGDTVYEARHDPHIGSLRYNNVLETICVIRDRPAFMSTVDNLALNLSQSLTIKGYAQGFEKITLHDRLDVDVRREWGPLVNAMKHGKSQYELMFLLGIISFRSDANMSLIQTLIAFAQSERLQSLDLPSCTEYCSFRPGQTPQLDSLLKIIEQYQAAPPEDPPLMEFASSKDQRKLGKARTAHAQKANTDCRKLAQSLLSQWPNASLSTTHINDPYLINVPAALEQVLPEWERLYRNHEFFIHLQAVQEILRQMHSDVKFQRPDFVASKLEFAIQKPSYEHPILGNLMKQSIPDATSNHPIEHTHQGGKDIQPRTPLRNGYINNASQELEKIIKTFSSSKSTIKKRYASDLKESLDAFNSLGSQTITSYRSINDSVFHLEMNVRGCFAKIKSAVERPSDTYSVNQVRWLQEGQLWPAVTPVTILEQLRSTSRRSFGSGMREGLLQFAVSITDWQRQMRIESYRRSNESSRCEEERQNIGHRNWRVEDYPDWLLLEVEANLLIRETQVEVALAIIAPKSRANSVLQLNMGQGKTSCIIPMVAVLLADKKSLVRVSVPKALLKQTAQLLHGRLGGLVGREIRHVPFSRRTSTREDHIKLYHRLHREIQQKCGVMLCLPEHQMSFMLSGLQRVLDQRIPEADMMIRVQGWLQSCARDVLDESDHTLAVKTQLIYPSGSQMAVNGHPHRWLIAEQVLGLVDMHLHGLSASFPHSIEVVRRPQGGYPFVFFLRPNVEEELINRLRHDICQGTRGILPVDTLESADRIAIKDFLSGSKVRQSSLDRVSRLCPDRPHIRQTVYLLRGLFVHRILIMVLKKRYGVQYGLHPFRDPVAVPFHAKGVPSEQSEFGHVDVAILLTALAFYYGGINKSQTRQALEAVLKSDDPASMYERWTEDEDFPDYLRDWHSINVDDYQQLSHIWNCVRFKVSVIDYFMNNFVFPPHAKQFKIRLQSNGWDIPLFSGTKSGKSDKNGANKLRGLTTGFSGTNDIKPLLPLTITQDDLASLSHTNGEVLTYLLQPRSRYYHVMVDVNQKRLNEIQFLYMLKRCNMRILIDAGAQILEQSNKELAANWLQVDGRATVALYFDGDSPYILSKQGMRTPLLASPYADNLNEVLVYLDEAHTRGTDLKFGWDACAALTLGLGQTKDHTVQAAMRLRQLGTTQSVEFFAPPEVNQSIRDLCNKRDNERVDSYDVIRWLINNTCDGIEQLQPLFYSQGIDFCNRMQAAEDFPDFLLDDEERTAFLDTIKQQERQTLQQLYGPRAKAKAHTFSNPNPKIAAFIKELDARKKTFQDTGQAVHASALQEVEQERETEVEVEAVRQVKKPMQSMPHKFPGLHRDLETFARIARIPAGSDSFVHILRALARTSLGRKYKINYEISTSQLFISSEFERTVKLVIESANDNFLRPVQWILYAPSPEAAVIVTPEEAELLIKIIQETEEERASPTRLLTYAAPVTRRMMHFNKLNFYTIPTLPSHWQPSEWLTTELGFFAGRLYFDWSEYNSICRMLGIDTTAPGLDEFDSSEMDTTDQGTTSAAETSTEATSHHSNGPLRNSKMSNPGSRPCSVKRGGLTPKPYTFTQEYLAVRRHGQDFTHTPMGFLCNGKSLNKDSPFFRSAETTQRPRGLVPVGTTQINNLDGAGADEMMDLGDYDPSAELKDDEDHEEIEYDESEMHQGGSGESGSSEAD